MAIAFGRSGAFSGTGATPLTVSVVINLGETVIVCVTFNPTTCAVTGVTDNASGGTSTYTKQGEVIQSTNVKHEFWSTAANGAKAATTVSAAFSGTNTDSGIVAAAYTGVTALGAFTTNSGTTSNPSIALSTQDNNNFIVAGFSVRGGGGITAFAGTTLRQADGDVSIDQAIADKTSATPASVTCQVTSTATGWGAGALELRTSAGGASTYVPYDIPHSAQHQSMVAQ